MYEFVYVHYFCLSGDVKTASVMDRERIPRYMFVAQATDGGGLFCRAKVLLTILDVNDNAPAFPNARYTTSVYESAIPKALLARLQALDPDEGQKPALCHS